MRTTKRLLQTGALTLSLLATGVMAAVSADEAAKLGNTLTPIGAEKAGNADGSIPAWTGGLPINAGAVDGGGFLADPFPNEKALFTITAQNVEQYKDKLTPGQYAMFKRYPETYRMPVFTTHRTATVPDNLIAATKRNATTTTLVPGGSGLQDYQMGNAFPIPKDGLEAIWNHITRYRGASSRRNVVQVTPQANGSFSPVSLQEEFAFRAMMPGIDASQPSNILFYFKQRVTAPSRLAGNVLLVHETINQVKEPRMAWLYNCLLYTSPSPRDS